MIYNVSPFVNLLKNLILQSAVIEVGHILGEHYAANYFGRGCGSRREQQSQICCDPVRALFGRCDGSVPHGLGWLSAE